MFKINKFLLTIISNDKFFFVLETNLIPFYLIFFFFIRHFFKLFKYTPISNFNILFS